MDYKTAENRYDKLLAFTNCVTSFDSNQSIPNTPSGSQFDTNHSYFNNTGHSFVYNHEYDTTYSKEETNYMNEESNNLMLLSQIINEPEILIGSGLNGQLTLNEEIDFLIRNPQYLSSSICNMKVNKSITQQLFSPNDTGRFPCRFCNANFKRVNGLKRHIMMHLNIKPYQCHQCFRCFARIDVFKRHLLRTKCVSDP